MKMAVVCRMNQVRSTFSEILISSQYPEIEICSAGVSLVSEKLPVERVYSIASDWGLNPLNLKPREIFEIKNFVESCDFLLLAESSFARYFDKWDITAKVKSFDELTLDENFMPKDPIDLREMEFRVELAKIGYVATRAVELETMDPPRFPIKIVIPLNASDAELAFTHARFERNYDNGFLIDIDFRSPNSQEFATQEEEYNYYQPGTFNVDQYLSSQGRGLILTPNREYRFPEKILIARDFHNRIRDFANVAPVTLISAPRCIQGVTIPDSFLAAISATTITTVGC